MKIVNLNFDILQLDGSILENAGKLIATSMVSDTKEPDAIKFYDWAFSLYRGDIINIDSSDFNKLRSFIVNHPHIFILVKGQVIKYLDSL